MGQAFGCYEEEGKTKERRAINGNNGEDAAAPEAPSKVAISPTRGAEESTEIEEGDGNVEYWNSAQKSKEERGSVVMQIYESEDGFRGTFAEVEQHEQEVEERMEAEEAVKAAEDGAGATGVELVSPQPSKAPRGTAQYPPIITPPPWTNKPPGFDKPTDELEAKLVAQRVKHKFAQQQQQLREEEEQ